MRLSDKEIRIPLYDFIENVEHRIRVIEEFSFGAAIADLLAVTDGILTGYEIKSDLDSYVRLKTQVREYSKYFDYCYAVIGRSHQKGILKHIPETWGILLVMSDLISGTQINVIRQATVNPLATLDFKLRILWRRELVNISFRNGLGKCSGKPMHQIKSHLKKYIDNNKLLRELTEELFERDYTVKN